MIRSFAPVIDQKTRFLILGTMPGEVSLAAGEYYAHRRNIFWKMMSLYFNNGRVWADYAEKISMLLEHGVGLWDNLESCDRVGCLDSHIRNARPNDIGGLLQRYPGVEKVLFNGQKSYEFFKKYQHLPPEKSYDLVALPSTSPANAGISFEEKCRRWAEALQIAYF